MDSEASAKLSASATAKLVATAAVGCAAVGPDAGVDEASADTAVRCDRVEEPFAKPAAAAAAHGFGWSGRGAAGAVHASSCLFLLPLAAALGGMPSILLAAAPSTEAAACTRPQSAEHQNVGRAEPTLPSLQKETVARHAAHCVRL